MSRRVVNITLDNLDDLPSRCRRCVFWELDPVAHDRAVEAGDTAFEKESWVSATLLGFASHAPGGLGVRIDSALYQGYEVPPFYDSLVAKLIVHGASREECLMRLRRALEEYVVGGIETTIPLHQRLVEDADFRSGDYDIHWLERFLSAPA